MNLKDRINQLLEGKGENYIFPFFWQHGEEADVLREYMQKIHDSNIGAVCVESRPHPEFAEDGWWRDMDVILEEAKRLNMKVWILDDKHFPTGYAVGKVENADKELCHQYLDHNAVATWGPRPQMEIPVEKYAKPQPTPPWMPPMPAPKRVFHDDSVFRVVACQVLEDGLLGEPVDLTDRIQDGKIIWDVPEGYWKIYITYLTRDARGRNDYINFLDAESCRILVDAVYEPHFEKYGDLFGTVIAGFFSDEPPIGNTPGYTGGDLIGNPEMSLSWSKEMAAAMDAEYGSGWELYVPYLWSQAKDDQQTARVRVAYMNAVSKLVSKCFSDQLGKWCEAHGVEYIGHMLEDCDSSANLGPSMGHFFRGLSGQHMAGIDNIGGQVVPGAMNAKRRDPGMCQDNAGFYHYMLGRMGTSMAVIDPKKKGRCMCENFGAYGWRMGVRTEKYLMDHFLVRGVNRYVPHAFSPKAFPDPDCPPHFYAHGENPQYRAFGELMAYTNRICHLIDGGVEHAPVALLYHGESQWAGAYQSNILACRVLTQNQINFLILPADVLESLQDHNASFDGEKGILTVNGVVCRALVISGCDYITRPAAEFAVKASTAGMPVIFTERLPMGVSDVCGEESLCLTKKLQNCPTVPVKELPELLKGWDYHELELEIPEPNVTVYHYNNGGNVYLLLNENTDKTIEQWITLPEKMNLAVYDAWENTLKPANVRAANINQADRKLADRESTEGIEEGRESTEGMQVRIHLAPLEMLVLVESDACVGVEFSCLFANATEAVELKDFKVTRCENKSYPAFAEEEEADLVHGMALKHPEFSGHYRYETKVELNGWIKAGLLIDDVYESAEVFVNGKSVGMKTAQPYAYDLKDTLVNGENSIVIEVATTLERKANAIGADVTGMGIPAPLSPTGIVGTVKLVR